MYLSATLNYVERRAELITRSTIRSTGQTRQDEARRSKTRHDKSRQDMTSQDKSSRVE